jgi:hypothetical protein
MNKYKQNIRRKLLRIHGSWGLQSDENGEINENNEPRWLSE